MKLDVLTNASVVGNALRFVRDKSFNLKNDNIKPEIEEDKREVTQNALLKNDPSPFSSVNTSDQD
jgi:hypothetical protein